MKKRYLFKRAQEAFRIQPDLLRMDVGEIKNHEQMQGVNLQSHLLDSPGNYEVYYRFHRPDSDGETGDGPMETCYYILTTDSLITVRKLGGFFPTVVYRQYPYVIHKDSLEQLPFIYRQWEGPGRGYGLLEYHDDAPQDLQLVLSGWEVNSLSWRAVGEQYQAELTLNIADVDAPELYFELYRWNEIDIQEEHEEASKTYTELAHVLSGSRKERMKHLEGVELPFTNYNRDLVRYLDAVRMMTDQLPESLYAPLSGALTELNHWSIMREAFEFLYIPQEDGFRIEIHAAQPECLAPQASTLLATWAIRRKSTFEASYNPALTRSQEIMMLAGLPSRGPLDLILLPLEYFHFHGFEWVETTHTQEVTRLIMENPEYRLEVLSNRDQDDRRDWYLTEFALQNQKKRQ